MPIEHIMPTGYKTVELISTQFKLRHLTDDSNIHIFMFIKYLYLLVQKDIVQT